MDRRIALKNMGLALGYTIATPTLISLVQSCKNDATMEWIPDFFTADEGSLITHLIDIIIPKTDTPSASEVQVNLFIDRFADQVMEKEQQDFIKLVMGKFVDRTLLDTGKEQLTDLTPEDIEPVLSSVLKISKEKITENEEAIAEFMEAAAQGETPQLADEVAQFAFASQLRNMTIWSYKTSEYVAEEVLAYLPVPGTYVACGDVDELTGGKAWSL